MNQLVEDVLKRNLAEQIRFGPDFNNHVPMTLRALVRLGAGADQLNRYVLSRPAPEYPVPPQPGVKNITRENWQNALATASFPQFVEFFTDWIHGNSVETVLRQCLPVLMIGVSSSAYHGLLRLAYALDSENHQEVACSLAYWSASFYSCPRFEPAAESVEPDRFFAEIVDAASGFELEKVPSIDGRIAQVYASDSLRPIWRPIRIAGPHPLDRMARLILETFSQSQHFTLLHAVTSCHAMRIVFPYLADVDRALSHYWHSVCAAYVTVSRSPFQVGRDSIPQEAPSWEEIAREAVVCDLRVLEHTVKLIYSCREEASHYDQDAYRAVAARELRQPSRFI